MQLWQRAHGFIAGLETLVATLVDANQEGGPLQDRPCGVTKSLALKRATPDPRKLARSPPMPVEPFHPAPALCPGVPANREIPLKRLAVLKR